MYLKSYITLYTTFTNFSTIYLKTGKVYTDEGSWNR